MWREKAPNIILHEGDNASAMASMSDLAAMRAQLAEFREALDTFWLLFAGSLVFFMQCGFGMCVPATPLFKIVRDQNVPFDSHAAQAGSGRGQIALDTKHHAQKFV